MNGIEDIGNLKDILPGKTGNRIRLDETMSAYKVKIPLQSLYFWNVPISSLLNVLYGIFETHDPIELETTIIEDIFFAQILYIQVFTFLYCNHSGF